MTERKRKISNHSNIMKKRKKSHIIWRSHVFSCINTDGGYPHEGRADKDSYPHDSNIQCLILRLQLSFAMIMCNSCLI